MVEFCDYCDFGKHKGDFSFSCLRTNPDELPFYYSSFNTYCGYANLDGIEITNTSDKIIFTETGKEVSKGCLLKLVYAIVEVEEILKSKGKSPWPRPNKSVLCGLFRISKEEYSSLKTKMRRIHIKKQFLAKQTTKF